MNRFSAEPHNKVSGNVLIGAFVVIVGMLLLVNNAIYELPDWIFRWHTALILIGLFVGIKNNWKDNTWLVLMVIGMFFTVNKVWREFDFWSVAFPMALLGMGIYMILRPNSRRRLIGKKASNTDYMMADPSSYQADTDASANSEANNADEGASFQDYTGTNDYLESVNVFGGSQQVVYSKNFKGGEIVAVFGGCDVNFSQADFNGVVKLEVVAVFGGAKIIVPTGWEVKSVVTAILGGVTDKRPIQPIAENNRKLLIIEGVAMFGGLEIRNF
ncbi:MAG: hypothetical protein EOO99_03155 [Pedobacter sp.]|nr:MAG: hypothetical protein EOO99_03155 [Pedobacter sp.]